jgi:hypothetical protein
MKDLKDEIHLRFEQFEAAWQSELQSVPKELGKAEEIYFRSYLQLVSLNADHYVSRTPSRRATSAIAQSNQFRYLACEIYRYQNSLGNNINTSSIENRPSAGVCTTDLLYSEAYLRPKIEPRIDFFPFSA